MSRLSLVSKGIYFLALGLCLIFNQSLAQKQSFTSQNVARDGLAARLADIVYENPKNVEKALRKEFGKRFEIIETAEKSGGDLGFKALSVRDIQTGNVFVVFAGTDDLFDIKADLELFEETRYSRFLPKEVWNAFPSVILDHQIHEAIDYYDRTRRLIGGDKIIVVGHSLGGLLAQLVGSAKSATVVSFNSPGMPDSLLFRHGILVNQTFDMIDYSRSTDLIGTFGTHLGTTVELGEASVPALKPFYYYAQHSISALSNDMQMKPNGELLPQASRPSLDTSASEEEKPRTKIDALDLPSPPKDTGDSDTKTDRNEDANSGPTTEASRSQNDDGKTSAPEGDHDEGGDLEGGRGTEKGSEPTEPSEQPPVDVLVNSWTQQQWEERELRAYEKELQAKYAAIVSNVDPQNPALEKESSPTTYNVGKPNVDPWKDKDPTEIADDLVKFIIASHALPNPEIDPIAPGVSDPVPQPPPFNFPESGKSSDSHGQIDMNSDVGGVRPQTTDEIVRSSPMTPGINSDMAVPSTSRYLPATSLAAAIAQLGSNCRIELQGNGSKVTGLALAADYSGGSDRLDALSKALADAGNGNIRIISPRTPSNGDFIAELERAAVEPTLSFLLIDDLGTGITSDAFADQAIGAALAGIQVVVINANEPGKLNALPNVTYVEPDVARYVRALGAKISNLINANGAVVVGIEKNERDKYTANVATSLDQEINKGRVNIDNINLKSSNAASELLNAISDGRNVLITDQKHQQQMIALASDNFGRYPVLIVVVGRESSTVYGPNFNADPIQVTNIGDEVTRWAALAAIALGQGEKISPDTGGHVCDIWRN